MNIAATSGLSTNLRRPLARAFPLALSVLAVLFLFPPGGRGQAANAAPPDSSTLTLDQFRALFEAHASRAAGRSRSPVDMKPADELFFQLLALQARNTALQRSVDRISEWSKSIQARFRLQTAPQLDIDAIRFAEGKRAAESAGIETEQAQIVERANKLLGRPLDASLVAAAPAREPVGPPPSNDLLTQAEELLDKLYQSYQFGGIPLGVLLWHEEDVYRTELDYRLRQARSALDATVGR
jgi:hypothetical protein